MRRGGDVFMLTRHTTDHTKTSSSWESLDTAQARARAAVSRAGADSCDDSSGRWWGCSFGRWWWWGSSSCWWGWGNGRSSHCAILLHSHLYEFVLRLLCGRVDAENHPLAAVAGRFLLLAVHPCRGKVSLYYIELEIGIAYRWGRQW
jgi:hypothetical protein